MTTTSLSTVKPDVDQITTEFQSLISTYDTWKDLIRSGTGQALTEMIAQFGAYDQYSIEMAYKQAFMETALTDSAVLAGARDLGVRIARKSPANVSVTFTRSGDLTDSLTIQPYSAFSVSSTSLFNRNSLVFAPGVASVTAILYEGTVQTLTQTGQGTDFQMFQSSETGFVVSNEDVVVRVANVQIPVSQTGVWNYVDKPAVADSTSKDGALLLMFGNDNYGTKPGVSSTVTVTYVVTSGAAGNNLSFSGQNVTYLGDADVTGIANTGLVNGGDEVAAEWVRTIGPKLFAAQNTKGTTKDDFRAIAVSYPGVHDAVVVGQHEVAPTDLRYMNLVRVSLLTDSRMTDDEWATFVAWYKQRVMYPVRFWRQDPIAYPVAVAANVYCSNVAELSVVKSKVEAAIRQLYTKRLGLLGRTVFKSDIYKAIEEADDSVLYAELLNPTSDTVVDILAPAQVQLEKVYPGHLVGQYSYGVSAINAEGESLVTNFRAVTLNNENVRITWSPVSGATGYRIYGRDGRDPRMLAYVPAGITTWLDDTTSSPGAPMPTLDTSGVHYASLSSMNINVSYSQRSEG